MLERKRLVLALRDIERKIDSIATLDNGRYTVSNDNLVEFRKLVDQMIDIEFKLNTL